MNDQHSAFSDLKSRLKSIWTSGDYSALAEPLTRSAVLFLDRIELSPGTRVLDLACGTGQIAIPAARAGAQVTGLDIAPNWLEQARAKAEAEGLTIQFDEGDAEDLPYDDASFDLVVTLIGAMFAPRPGRVASEMTRVCRSGGRIVMGNWTPEGLIGEMFRVAAKHVPPPANMPSPLEWGKDETVAERLRDGIADLSTTRMMYPFTYPFPPARVVEYYAEHFGPTIQALKSLDAAGKKSLLADLEELWTRHNQMTDGTTYADAELLVVAAVRS